MSTPMANPCKRCGGPKRHATDPLCASCSRGDVLPEQRPKPSWRRYVRGWVGRW